MAKDPCFAFYSNDFDAKTKFFTHEQVGMYLRLLIAEHQNGRLTENQMKFICGRYDKDVFQKFSRDETGLFFNERLEFEINKRKAYSESRSKNRSKTYDNHILNTSKTYVPHMDNESDNDKDNEIDIWKVQETFLSEDEIWWEQSILLKSKLTKEEIIKSLIQYWLKLRQSNNKENSLRSLRAGFQKWLNTWTDKNKGKNLTSKPEKKQGYDYTEFQNKKK